VRFEFENQKAYDQIPGGQLDVDPPPSLIATSPRPASAQMNEAPTAEAAANELRDIPRRRARAVKKVRPGGMWFWRSVFIIIFLLHFDI
jgi:hypothetical protein